MNVILFEPEEIGRPLSRRDPRGEHVAKILHKEVGASFEAGLIDGPLGEAVIKRIGSDSIDFEFRPLSEPPASYPIRIVIGIPRPIVLRRLLKDLATLGVEAIYLAATDSGEKSYLASGIFQGSACRDALVDGAMQGFTTRIPDFRVFADVAACLEGVEDDPASSPPRFFVFDNRSEAVRFSLVPAVGSPAFLAVGSERGWSDRERAAFSRRGFVPARIGDRVLRTETACVAASVLALEKLGFF
jgi:16S rRNA (uracil1498-N3)-methyltransferase